MEYRNYNTTIQELYQWIEDEKIDLHPSYQRNYIWGKSDQQALIESILKGYPLPNFFVYKKDDDKMEMVDGQQRATTIHRYMKGLFLLRDKSGYANIDQERFRSYLLNITEIANLEEGEKLEDFYARVNKQGVHLNTGEINKAMYFDTKFMHLVEDIMELQEIADLDIFTTSAKNRMNDRTLVEELVAYLFKGITDKRLAVEELFNADLDEEKVQEIKVRFEQVLARIAHLNEITPIKETRYRQRNDFYTLFTFVDRHMEESNALLEAQYQLLVYLDDLGVIRPTNFDCEFFKLYALNCVSQSNSKNARQMRLELFETLLCNMDEDDETLMEIIEYLEDKAEQKVHMAMVEDCYLIVQD